MRVAKGMFATMTKTAIALLMRALLLTAQHAAGGSWADSSDTR